MGGVYWCSCKAKTETVCPQHSKQKGKGKKRKVERIYLGSAVQSEARYRERGVNWGGLESSAEVKSLCLCECTVICDL